MSYEKCLCDNGILSLKYKKNDSYIFQCDFCELMTVRPLPDRETLKNYYEKNYLSGRYANRMNDYAVRLRERTFDLWFALIKDLLPASGTLLDIGCGDGTAMNVAQKYGFDVFGNDISENATKNVNNGLREKIYAGISIENINLRRRSFDCITMFDFIEHTDNPLSYLNICHDLLKDEGRLIISTHDTKSIMKKIMGRHWSYLNPDEHLNFFTKKSLKIFLEISGFKISFIKNVPKYVNLEFLYNEFKWTSNLLHRIFSLIKKILPSKLWNAGFYFYFGEILCVAVKVKK